MKDVSIAKNKYYVGNVIMIPNAQIIVVSISESSEYDVVAGDKVTVYEPAGSVEDENGNILGELSFPKEILEVVDVDNSFFTCKKVIRTTENSLSNVISPFFKNVEKISYGDINVNDKQNKNMDIINPYVSIGDPVKIVR